MTANPQRTIVALDLKSKHSRDVSNHGEQSLSLSIPSEISSLEHETFDGVVIDNILGEFVDPLEILSLLSGLLRPGGWIVATIPNIGQHSVITSLLQGEWHTRQKGLLEARQLRFFTMASLLKLLLDAGYAPEIVHTVATSDHSKWLQAIQPLASIVGTAPERLEYSVNASHFIVRAQLLPRPSVNQNSNKLTFSVCVSREEVLHANLLASPDLQLDRSHTILLGTAATSAAAIHNQALERAPTDWVICLHQDVYLPKNWITQFLQRLYEAEAALGKLSVVGVYGIAGAHRCSDRAGHVLDRSKLRHERTQLPCLVHSLDELLIAVRRDSGLRFDQSLGWHLYGTDICLEAQRRGLRAAAIDSLCYHNSHSVGLPIAFYQSEYYLAHKWPECLPLVTSCKIIG